MICSKGGCKEAVKDQMEVAWCKWRELTGVTCDRKIPLKLKTKVYKTMIRRGRNVDNWGKGREYAGKNRDESAKMDDWS